jgi:hypothetical protein
MPTPISARRWRRRTRGNSLEQIDQVADRTLDGSGPRSCERPFVRSERRVPLRSDAAQQRRVDDQFAERIDRSHVIRGEGANLAHVDGEVEAVARGSLNERAERSSVRRAIDDLVQLLVLKAVDDAKESVGCSRRRERTRAVLIGEALRKAFGDGARRGPVPPKQAAHEKAHRQQRSDRRRRLPKEIPGALEELGERNSATRARQIYGPNVVEGNARKKLVDAQGEQFKLLARHLIPQMTAQCPGNHRIDLAQRH